MVVDIVFLTFNSDHDHVADAHAPWDANRDISLVGLEKLFSCSHHASTSQEMLPEWSFY